MQYEVIVTKDGSPSLRGKDESGQDGESMHHLAGAYSETQYIYGDALRTPLSSSRSTFSVLVVGLGLGYIELLAMGEYLKQQPEIPFHLYSYEIDEELRNSFVQWLGDSLPQTHSLFPVYEAIAACFEKDQYSIANIKKELLKVKNENRWILKERFQLESLPSKSVNCILYDAYSGFSTPELWQEEFLKSVFQQVAPEACVFSTYACTGVLKRALTGSGFQFQKKPGFAGKRDSTFALKNS